MANNDGIRILGHNGNFKVVENATVIRGIASANPDVPGEQAVETIAIVQGVNNPINPAALDAKGATVFRNVRVVMDQTAFGNARNLPDGSHLTISSTKNENLIQLPSRTHLGTEYPAMTLSTGDKPHTDVQGNAKHILILGAGVSGLLVAWMLLDKGYRVTIFADDWAWTKDFKKSRMTSQIAGALWEFPPGGCGLTEIQAAGSGWATVDHYQEWALQSYEFYHKYDTEVSNLHEKHGASLGLRFANLHQFFNRNLDALSGEERDKLNAIKDAHARQRMMRSELREYPRSAELASEFGSRNVINTRVSETESLQSGYTHRAPILNTDKAMAYLLAVVKAKGATLETRSFNDGRTILDFGRQLLEDHHGDAIVNATGLGAGKLMKDPDVYPVRGAILRVDNTRRGQFRHLNDAYLVPAQRDANNSPTKTIFIVPRSDDVLYVGSIIQPGNYDKTLTPESPEVEAMWDRAGEFIPRLHHAKLVPEYPFAQGLRPFSKKNAKVRVDEKARFRLVHNYGHGGSGWTLGIGTARCAVLLLERMLGVEVPSVDESTIRPTDEDKAGRSEAEAQQRAIDRAWETACGPLRNAAKDANRRVYPDPPRAQAGAGVQHDPQEPPVG